MQVLQAAGFLYGIDFTHFVDIINTPATFYVPTFYFSNTHIALLHHHQTKKCLRTEMYFARMRLPPQPAAYWIQPPRHFPAPWAYQNVTWWLNLPRTKTKNPSTSRSRWGYTTISEVRCPGLGLKRRSEHDYCHHRPKNERKIEIWLVQSQSITLTMTCKCKES